VALGRAVGRPLIESRQGTRAVHQRPVSAARSRNGDVGQGRRIVAISADEVARIEAGNVGALQEPLQRVDGVVPPPLQPLRLLPRQAAVPRRADGRALRRAILLRGRVAVRCLRRCAPPGLDGGPNVVCSNAAEVARVDGVRCGRESALGVAGVARDRLPNVYLKRLPQDMLAGADPATWCLLVCVLRVRKETK
jgi:hypothetical protein